jgi:hypothetical protein
MARNRLPAPLFMCFLRSFLCLLYSFSFSLCKAGARIWGRLTGGYARFAREPPANTTLSNACQKQVDLTVALKPPV